MVGGESAEVGRIFRGGRALLPRVPVWAQCGGWGAMQGFRESRMVTA